MFPYHINAKILQGLKGFVDFSEMLHCRVFSVTRLGNLVYFGQLFKSFGNNYFGQIAHILGKFCKVVKIYHFSSEIIFGQLL